MPRRQKHSNDLNVEGPLCNGMIVYGGRDGSFLTDKFANKADVYSNVWNKKNRFKPYALLKK
ncbi:MAG: hypothetical protein H7211_05370 [Aquabacterium sp.]|nr:hypothetical protein [Ferruginibacter sp.]